MKVLVPLLHTEINTHICCLLTNLHHVFDNNNTNILIFLKIFCVMTINDICQFRLTFRVFTIYSLLGKRQVVRLFKTSLCATLIYRKHKE